MNYGEKAMDHEIWVRGKVFRVRDLRDHKRTMNRAIKK